MTTAGVEPVEIRRNGRLSAGIALIAAAMTVAYLNRAAGSGLVLDWVLCGVMAVVALWQLVWLVDARTPLLLADEQGVRIRLAHDWLGVPWAAIEQVLVEHRDTAMQEGRLVVRVRNLGNALEGLEPAAQREVRWQRRLHGAPLAVPLSWATVSTSDDIAGDLRVLADRRADVTLVTGPERAVIEETPRPEPVAAAPSNPVVGNQQTEVLGSAEVDDIDDIDDVAEGAEGAEGADLAEGGAEAADEVALGDEAEETPARVPLTSRLAQMLGRLGGSARDVDHDVDHDADQKAEPKVEQKAELEGEDKVEAEVDDKAEQKDGQKVEPEDETETEQKVEPEDEVKPEPVTPVRAARKGVRNEVTSDLGPRRPSTEPAARLVIGDDEDADSAVEVEPDSQIDAEPERVPVIGPEIRAARERAGVSIEEMSRRTMVRPHVLAGIEVDDFEPCGGDFYARGHLTTLARYLGLDGEAMVREYDERYSHAPINARRVFEAELATGLGSGMRTTSAGPRWSLLAAVVLGLLMVWGVARFFTETPTEIVAPNSSVSDSAEMAGNDTPITSPLTEPSTITVVAHGGDTRVTILDRSGDVLWQGNLADGTRRELVGIAPFQVEATHGVWTQVHLDGELLGDVGTDLNPATRSVG